MSVPSDSIAPTDSTAESNDLPRCRRRRPRVLRLGCRRDRGLAGNRVRRMHGGTASARTGAHADQQEADDQSGDHRESAKCGNDGPPAHHVVLHAAPPKTRAGEVGPRAPKVSWTSGDELSATLGPVIPRSDRSVEPVAEVRSAVVRTVISDAKRCGVLFPVTFRLRHHGLPRNPDSEFSSSRRAVASGWSTPGSSGGRRWTMARSTPTSPRAAAAAGGVRVAGE